jgi:hypothetical protein
MGPQAVSVTVNLNSALAYCNSFVLTIDKLSGCTTAQKVKDIPNPDQNGLVGFKGSAIFILGPVLCNTIITSNLN